MLQLWGGVESTVNRVRDRYLDQLLMSGHDRRHDDLMRFAELGIKTLRFPILWERHAPQSLEQIDWTWADKRLSLARELGVRVIVGFAHHGSGPRYTSLLDPHFANKLERYADAFARRYPWVDAYTPINEPLTTARFSGLYGCWYPHASDTRSFLRMLWNECEGIRAAMRAIRSTNPSAQLIQTEDLGKIFSTTFLSYQAEFENHRRWLSFDILTGRLDEAHPLYAFCLKHGLGAEEMADFVRTPIKPDLLGINHYISSNRFLDERIERYPSHVHGGNDHHRYADIEAVRVGAEIIVGPKELLEEAWLRYGIPLAVTEAHLGCTREEQMRWLYEIWNAAKDLNREGIKVEAVTVWSLLGGFDWNSLITKTDGYYEPGVFDLRAPQPRPTALAAMVKALGQGQDFDHPVLDNPGWWHRPDRLLYPSVNLDQSGRLSHANRQSSARKRQILITGASGTLGNAFAYLCEKRGLPYRLVSRPELDLGNAERVRHSLHEIRPWAIVNAAGYCRVDRAEDDQAQCYRDNVCAAIHLADYCADSGARLVSFSSDLVFDGKSQKPYCETDQLSPINVYGQSKAKAEAEILSRFEQGLVIRTSSFFGPWDEYNFLTTALRTIAKGHEFYAADDLFVSPTYVPELADAALDLMLDGEQGIWHVTNQGVASWAVFGRMAAKANGMNPLLIVKQASREFDWPARRPSYSALTSIKAQIMPDLERSIDSYIRECRVALR